MFYIYTPCITPSGKRISHSKIIIYEAVPSEHNGSKVSHYNVIRKFELTRKGWKTSKASGEVWFRDTASINTASTVPLNPCRLLHFDSFDNAYAAKCILISRIPEVYLNMISVLTAKMNSIKLATPELQYMSDAVPELFL